MIYYHILIMINLLIMLLYFHFRRQNLFKISFYYMVKKSTHFNKNAIIMFNILHILMYRFQYLFLLIIFIFPFLIFIQFLNHQFWFLILHFLFYLIIIMANHTQYFYFLAFLISLVYLLNLVQIL